MRIVSTKVVFHCPILNIEEREVEHTSGTRATRWVVMHVPNVEVIALTQDKNIVFITARRGMHGVESFEFPGGKVMTFSPSEEDLRLQAQEELQTETGFKTANLHQIHRSDMNTDWLERSFYYFAAWDLEPGESQLEEGEDLTTVLITVPEVEKRLADKDFPNYLVTPLRSSLEFFRNRGLI